MYVLLSPAKKIREPVPAVAHPTTPSLSSDAEVLSRTTKQLSTQNLKDLMGLSDNLATLNRDRFQTMNFPHNQDNATPAALTFNGDVYVGLDAPSLSADALAWAQDHVGILSGLYGLLRPLDLIQPYRLEMGTALKTKRGSNLYQFWGDKIAQEINEYTASKTTPVVLNLASNEYFKAASAKKINAPIITPVFKEIRNGKAKIISFYAKKARGTMTRYIIDNRIEDPESIKGFDRDGYVYRDDLSTESNWVFTREGAS